MARMSVSDLKPGMPLQEEVRNAGGALLLKAGVELSEKHIGVLKKWGIKEVLIQEAPKESNFTPGESIGQNRQALEEYESWKTQTLAKFLGREEDPIIQAIALAALPLLWMDVRKSSSS